MTRPVGLLRLLLLLLLSWLLHRGEMNLATNERRDGPTWELGVLHLLRRVGLADCEHLRVSRRRLVDVQIRGIVLRDVVCRRRLHQGCSLLRLRLLDRLLLEDWGLWLLLLLRLKVQLHIRVDVIRAHSAVLWLLLLLTLVRSGATVRSGTSRLNFVHVAERIFGVLAGIKTHAEPNHGWAQSNFCQLRLDQEDEALKEIVMVLVGEEHRGLVEQIVAEAVSQLFDIVFFVD